MDKEELEWAIGDAKSERESLIGQAKLLTKIISQMKKQLKSYEHNE